MPKVDFKPLARQQVRGNGITVECIENDQIEILRLREVLQRHARIAEHNIDLRLRALATSQRMWLCDHGDAGDWRERMQDEPANAELAGLAAHLLDSHLPHAVVVDCSASDAVAACYPDWLAAGIHVITPNKQAGAGPLPRYRAIRDAERVYV